ncbi:MAG: MFS transporter [Bacteroidetes bacterium GWF2_42_66]|nr:MAG: MFS transporter [Bacteroidetes bacterium GWA2_42_15]OFX98786.1 MAG: MFS transporter [Bacteroidetes bacterium GWE2_42_39]OFY43017.1 MAG: MFS transporter [Bacteroidetes bacterium GWF2_42_66]HBL77146.1 MFS transporter [Prolixibacteraceae bacterium]HCR91437.1 MFS transporter [Prolixibacteraceae bacterium]
MKTIKLYRFIPWIIVFLAFIATSLSFLDRQVLSISIIKIKDEFLISDVAYGFINTGFLIGYAIMFTVGGILIDRYGSRLGLAVSVGFWSVATGLHSLANSTLHFGILRFLLGIGEGGAFPGAVRAVVEWVPKKRQALANGIAIGGSALGAVVAPLLCIWLMGIIGWRGLFIISCVIGLIWVVVWLMVSRKKYNRRSESEAEYLTELPEDKKIIGFSQLIKIRETWIFIAMRFLLDPIMYFYMFWIPKYLNEFRGNNLEQVGKLFWVPFLALGVSNMLGGWLSDTLFIKKSNLDYARKSIMGLAALLMLPVLSVKFMPSSEWVIAIISIAFFAHGLWITNYITSISDTFGKSSTSTVIGMSGTAGAICALVLNPVIGFIITKFSYNPMWWYAGSMYLVAFIVFVIFIPKLKLLKAFV